MKTKQNKHKEIQVETHCCHIAESQNKQNISKTEREKGNFIYRRTMLSLTANFLLKISENR